MEPEFEENPSAYQHIKPVESTSVVPVREPVLPIDPGWQLFVPGALALTKSAIGSGVLSLPHALSKTGWFVGLLMFFVTAGGAFLSLALLYMYALSDWHSRPFRRSLRQALCAAPIIDPRLIINYTGFCFAIYRCAHAVGGRETSWYSLAHKTYPWLSPVVDVVIGTSPHMVCSYSYLHCQLHMRAFMSSIQASSAWV